MGKTRNTGYLGNIVTYDASNNIVLPALLTVGTAPDSSDNSGKVPSTAWVRNYVTNLGYQSVLTLTTTGSSGAATLVGNTLNIPNYTLNGLGGEPAVTAGTSSQYYRGDKTFQTLNTTAVAEGTNLYYTDARVGSYLTTNSYATQTYVNTQVSNLVNSAPATLDTLNELAAALGNDPNFATTIATSIGTKLPLAGGTLTGALIGTSATFSNTVEIFDNTNSGILKLSRDAGGQRGQLQFGRNNGGTFQVTGMIGSDSDTASPNNGTLYFYTSNSSGVSTQRLIISGTGAATFSSSVTTTSLLSSSSLDGDPVLAAFTNTNSGTSAEATIYVRNGNTSNDATFLQTLGTGFTTTGGFVQDGGTIGTGTALSGGLSLIVRANADMRFYTNGHTNQRMIITSGGNVGIGVSPDLTLSINGAMNLRNSTRAGAMEIDASGNLWLGTATTAGNIYLETGHSTTGLPSTGTSRLTLNSSGATFSSSVTASSGSASVFAGFLVQNTTNSSYALYQSKTNNSSLWQWGTWNDNSYRVGISGVGDFLTIANGGSATFSSSVTADYLTANSGALINTTVNQFVLYNSGGGGNAKRFGLVMTNADIFKIYAQNDNGTTRADNIITATINGNVGIGTSSPASYGTRNLDVNAASGGSAYVVARANSNAGITEMAFDTDAGYISTKTNHPLIFRTNDVERMRITSGGKVNITNNIADYGFTMVNSNFSSYGLYIQAGGTYNSIECYNYSGSTALFRVSGGGVLYAQNTTVQSISDIRTKENITTSTDGLNIINALRPVRFDFKEGFGNDRKNVLGFIAQEVEEIFPDIVDTWKNKPDDEIEYKTLGPGGLIPVLVKAIQEQQQQIEYLKNKI